jgi:hypothetical protein
MKLYCIRHQEIEIRIEALEHKWRYNSTPNSYLAYERQIGDMLVHPCQKCLEETKVKSSPHE